MSNLDIKYQEKWELYRKRKNIKKISWFIYCGLLIFIYYFLGNSENYFICFFLLFASYMTIEIFVADFDCPKCRKKFFRKNNNVLSFLLSKATSKNCVHCGLNLYEGSTHYLKS